MHGGAGGGMGGGSMGGPKDPWEELVANNPEPRNWRGILISILVILLVIFLVGLSVRELTPDDPGLRVRGERIRLDQILEERFQPTRYNATYVDSSLVYITGEGGLSVYSPEKGSSLTLLDNTTFRLLNSIKYEIDDRLEMVLIASEIQPIFRHSTLAKYTVFNTKDRTKPLIPVGINSSNEMLRDQEKLQYATFLPANKDNNRGMGACGIVFVANNDLYYMPKVISGGEVHRLTSTGQAGTIYNGVADWLYEEEILGRSNAIWSSPTGSKLAFAMFNDSDVNLITLREYGNADSTRPGRKPREKAFRYPKAGEKNPRVSLYVVNLETKDKYNQHVRVVPPNDIVNSDHYLMEAAWLSETDLCVLWMNRGQDIAYYTLCKHPDFICKQILVERATDVIGAGWVDHWGIPHFSKNGVYYPQLVFIPVSTSHVIPPTQLTGKLAEVTKILGWDHDTGFVYYMGTAEGQPGERHLYRMNVSSHDRHSEQLTDPILCEYNRIHMAPTFTSYVQECLGPSVPWVKYISLPDNIPVFFLDTNQKVRDQIQYSSMPRDLYTSVELPVSSPGQVMPPARVHLTLPPVLREYEDFIFPLIVNVYGGPGTQTVDSQWSVGWHTYLASNRDFIVANIDVRGSGYQGLNLKHSVARKLGALEPQDIIHVVREIVDTYNFIDRSKICVWGWSFGGYLTTKVLALDGENSIMQGKESLFACGIAVAPVAQWQNYDSAYTEKYMGLPSPDDNWKGYLELYPDENHGLFGVIKHQHLTMETFFDQIFGPLEDYFLDDYYLAASLLVQDLQQEAKENGIS